MTQNERWLVKYNKVAVYIETNHKNPSKHRVEEHLMLNSIKHNIEGIADTRGAGGQDYTIGSVT